MKKKNQAFGGSESSSGPERLMGKRQRRQTNAAIDHDNIHHIPDGDTCCTIVQLFEMIGSMLWEPTKNYAHHNHI